MTVLAAGTWNTNGELIADVAKLYLDPEMATLDPTYGRGLWWTEWRPHGLTTHDRALDGIDFRKLPESDGTYDLAAFDPPYVCVGGRKTTTIPDFHDRYGMTDAPITPAALQEHNNDGLAEVYRVLRPEGLALVKCADYISSGRLWPGTHHTLTAALDLGFGLVDRFTHVGHVRPQPARRTRRGPDGERIASVQQHARQNSSVLYVLVKRR